MSLLSSSAFDLTEEEKAQCTEDILSNLVRATAIINGRQKLSAADCGEALSFLRDALMLAYDDDACDSAPWSQCHLNLGHIMRAQKRLVEAEDAYTEAASVSSMDFSELAAAKEASAFLLYLQEQKKTDRRKGGIWTECGLLPPSVSDKTRGQRLRDRLNSAAKWNPEGNVVVQRITRVAKQPRIVTPESDILPYRAGKR